MLSRDVAEPPSTSLAMIRASGSSVPFTRSTLAGDDHRLRALRPVDQHDLRPRRRRRRRRRSWRPSRDAAGCPGAEARSRAAACISASVVSPTTKIVPLSGRIHAAWKATRSSRVTALTPCGGARSGERHAIGMLRAVERRRQHAQRDALRLGHLGGDPREQRRAQPLDLGGAKAGLRTMSANRSSDGAEVGLERGQRHAWSSPSPPDAAIVAPSRSCSSAIAVESRVVVPSSSSDGISACVPSLRAASAALPASKLIATRTTGTRRAACEHHLDAVRQRRALDRRELRGRRPAPTAGSAAAGSRLTGARRRRGGVAAFAGLERAATSLPASAMIGGRALAGLDRQLEHRPRQPLARHRPTLAGVAAA